MCPHPFTKCCLQPIVMRAEFAYAPNLTIIDTPGFILKARRRRWCAGLCVSGGGRAPLFTKHPRLAPLPSTLQPRSSSLSCRRARARRTTPPTTSWPWSRHSAPRPTASSSSSSSPAWNGAAACGRTWCRRWTPTTSAPSWSAPSLTTGKQAAGEGEAGEVDGHGLAGCVQGSQLCRCQLTT